MQSSPFSSHRRARLAMALLAAIGLAGCGDALGPEGELDPVAASERADEIYATLAGHPALESMSALESWSPSGAAPAVALMAATLPFAPTGSEQQWLGDRLAQLAAAGPYVTSAEPAVMFPADLLGKTLVYNPETEKYEVDPSLTGAPANGIRFILYAIDPVFKRPLVDTPVGHADFTDRSTPTADVLGIEVVISDRTVVDYEASAIVEVLSGKTLVFGAVGFVDDGRRRLDFDLTQRLSEEHGVAFDYLLEVAGEDASVRLTAAAEPEQPVSIELTVQDGRGKVVLSLTVNDAELSGSVTMNDAAEPAVVISGTPEEPVFTHPDGTPLTEEETRAVRQLFRLVDKLTEVVRKLLRPAHRILNVPVFTI